MYQANLSYTDISISYQNTAKADVGLRNGLLNWLGLKLWMLLSVII